MIESGFAYLSFRIGRIIKRIVLDTEHKMGIFWETKTQHLLVVSPGNLFRGLRLSPFDDESRRRRGDTNTSSSVDLPSTKNFHLFPMILPSTFDLLLRIPGSFKYIPTTGGMARRWMRRGKRRVIVIHSRKVEKDTLGGALHFYEVDKKGRFLGCRTPADIYGTEKSLRDEI